LEQLIPEKNHALSMLKSGAKNGSYLPGGTMYARKIEEEIRCATMINALCPMIAKLNYGLATSHGANRCRDAEALLSAAMRDLWHAKSGAAIHGAAAAGNA